MPCDSSYTELENLADLSIARTPIAIEIEIFRTPIIDSYLQADLQYYWLNHLHQWSGTSQENSFNGNLKLCITEPFILEKHLQHTLYFVLSILLR